MKKILILAAVVLGSTFTSVRAGNPDINAVVKEAFRKQFPAASEAEWSTLNNYYKVCFQFNGNYVQAFYASGGEFMAAMRNISSVTLPVMLQADLKKDYAGYWISGLYELSKTNSNSYFITLENADQKIVLKSENGSAWALHKKTGKV